MRNVDPCALDRKRTDFAEPTDPTARLFGDSIPPPPERPRADSPTISLARAILEDAIALVLGKAKGDEGDLADAIEWMTEGDDDRPLAFDALAYAVGLDGAAIREQLANEIERARRRLPRVRICPTCGKSFVPSRRPRRRRVFCSTACVRRRGHRGANLIFDQGDHGAKVARGAGELGGASRGKPPGRAWGEERRR